VLTQDLIQIGQGCIVCIDWKGNYKISNRSVNLSNILTQIVVEHFLENHITVVGADGFCFVCHQALQQLVWGAVDHGDALYPVLGEVVPGGEHGWECLDGAFVAHCFDILGNQVCDWFYSLVWTQDNFGECHQVDSTLHQGEEQTAQGNDASGGVPSLEQVVAKHVYELVIHYDGHAAEKSHVFEALVVLVHQQPQHWSKQDGAQEAEPQPQVEFGLVVVPNELVFILLRIVVLDHAWVDFNGWSEFSDQQSGLRLLNLSETQVYIVMGHILDALVHCRQRILDACIGGNLYEHGYESNSKL